MATPSRTQKHSNLEAFTLIWLDSLVNTSQDNIETKPLLRKAINRLKTFEDSEKCVEYIRSLSRDRVVLIISGRLGHVVVPVIHRFPQLIAIYVYCSDIPRNKEWSKRFSKIKGVIDDLPELIRRIQADQTKRNEYKIDEPLPINFFSINSQSQILFLAINNDNFINFQLLIDCLSRMRWDSHDKERFISLCKEEYQGNASELRNVCEFEENYKPDRAIWWFTRESFVCRMLNKAFQILNIDLLYYFHFLIRDIQRQLKDKKPSSPICAYRAQLMSNEELLLVKNSIGELISINTFLSAMPNRDRALEILKNSDASNDLNRVLFEIDADPRPHDTKPFGDITSLNYFTGVEIILFMVGTIFHPINIRKENNIIIIHMETCRDSDKKLKVLFEQTKTEDYNDQTNLVSLASILSKMKKFNDAEIYYLRVLNENPNDHHSVACCYRGLGNIAIEKEDYHSSIHFYRKALDVDRFTLRPEDPEIATGYCTLAYAYVQSGAYFDAHELYNEALQILIRGFDKDHPKVAVCYKNMGCAFEMEKKYSEAINCYQKALDICEKPRSVDHLDAARLHNHIGSAYTSIGDLQKAFKHYNLALKIMTKSNSGAHLNVVATMKSISHVLETGGNLNQALAQLQKAATIQSQILPSNHPDIIKTTQDIQRLSSKIK